MIERLDYVKGLGTTAIWLTPSFKNKPVQGLLTPFPSAAYHGYWITDFTQIDPHLGTNQDLRDLIAGAHRRGMKVFFDIITNHTADVIDYREATCFRIISSGANTRGRMAILKAALARRIRSVRPALTDKAPARHSFGWGRAKRAQ